MMQQRPELGATLDHVSIRSVDPDRLARFLATAYALTPVSGEAAWQCEAPGRTFLVSHGTNNTLSFFAYAFETSDELRAYRSVVEKAGHAFDANPSPLFGGSAFSVRDPDGNVLAMGVRRALAPGSGEPLPARLQHCAFRTSKLDPMVAFYVSIGFVVSDRVEDDAGVLRACFLRSDHEHHALALFASPESRLDHISCETRDVPSVVAWADRMAAERIPLHWGIGRHGPGNDVFFMVKDPDGNLLEISADLEVCAPQRAAGRWRHEQRTLNLWGTAILRS